MGNFKKMEEWNEPLSYALESVPIASAKGRMHLTLFEGENERQKIEPVPIPLPRASRNFPDVKTRNEIFFHNWTSEIIPFIRFGMQMDGT